MIIKNKHYGGQIELIFDSFKHQYKEGAEVITSVTQALSVINKPALISWAANMAIEYASSSIEPGVAYDEIQLATIWDASKKAHWQKKTEAGTVGTFVHKWIEQYINGENPGIPVNEGLKESVDKFLTWVQKHRVVFLSAEQPVYSKKYRYTGTLDFICKIDGKLYVGDLKTGAGIYNEYFLQTAAYRQARSEEFPEEKYAGQLILRIGKDGSFEFAKVSDYQSYKLMLVGFIAALKLFEILKELKDFEAEKEKL